MRSAIRYFLCAWFSLAERKPSTNEQSTASRMKDAAMARTQTHTDKRIPARRQTGSVRLQQLSRYLFVAPALAYITLTMIYPVLSNLRMSFYDVNVSTF